MRRKKFSMRFLFNLFHKFSFSFTLKINCIKIATMSLVRPFVNLGVGTSALEMVLELELKLIL